MIRTIFTFPCSTQQLVDIQTLEKIRQAVRNEHKINKCLVLGGSLNSASRSLTGSGAQIINTLYAAADVVDKWFTTHSLFFDASHITTIRQSLSDIMADANAVPMITDPYEGEDDSQLFIKYWIELMWLHWACVRKSRMLQLCGCSVSTPDHILYPPRRILSRSPSIQYDSVEEQKLHHLSNLYSLPPYQLISSDLHDSPTPRQSLCSSIPYTPHQSFSSSIPSIPRQSLSHSDSFPSRRYSVGTEPDIKRSAYQKNDTIFSTL